MSANSLTEAIIKYLCLNGWKAWRQNNAGVYDQKIKRYRKPPKTAIKGVPDVIGFNKKSGVFIGVEVKIGKDKLSVEQRYFLEELNVSGGIGIVAKSIDDFIEKYNQILNK